MGFRLGVFFLLVALACMVVDSTPFASWDSTDATLRYHGGVTATLASAAYVKVGDLISQDEEMMMDSEVSRRVLNNPNYISYNALQKNNVPCNRRGNSYYNCQKRSRANPYRRGCNQITRCARRV